MKGAFIEYKKPLAAFALGLLIGVAIFSRFPTAQEPTPVVPNSAPPFAITACLNKDLGDECQMNFDNRSIIGVCGLSGEMLACGPTLPNQTVN